MKRSLFRLLAWGMVGLGLAIGVLFPLFTVLMGFPVRRVLAPPFVGATLTAGLVVGIANYLLAKRIVGTRIRLLATRTRLVADNIRAATFSGDWSQCSTATCMVPVDSDDALGESAAAFNELLDALTRSHEVESAFSSLSQTLVSHLDVDTLSEAALKLLEAYSGSDAGAIFLIRDADVVLAAEHNLVGAEALAHSRTVEHALATTRSNRIEVTDPLTIDGILVRFRPRSVVTVPIVFNGVALGLVLLASAHPISDDTLQLLESFRPPLATSISNALVHERFQRLAAVDSLTGLYNRRFGFERLEEEYARATRSRQALGVLMFDIDHFKQVNDSYGHLTGDRVLKAVGTAARRVLRHGDLLIRYGGEEFLAVLPGANLHDVERLGEGIRHAVMESSVVHDGQRLSPTVSLGGASIPELAADNAEMLVARADAALYVSKQAGRNRLTLAMPTSA